MFGSKSNGRDRAEGNLVELIRTKICGEALETIVGQEFATIDALLNFLKDIYVTTRSVKQLLGDLGNEYQREDENVITFANRIRDIGNHILEAQPIAVGNVTAEFKTETQNDVIECFIDGLLPEIENKITEDGGITDLIKEAIEIERKLRVQRGRRPSTTTETKQRRKQEIFTCQLCKEESKTM